CLHCQRAAALRYPRGYAGMIVIPMAGLSKRFLSVGYDQPKYMLPLGEQTVFDRAVDSFRAWFQLQPFLFVGRDVAGTAAFIERSCRAQGLRQVAVVMLDEPTAGQAETVQFGLDRAGVGDDAPITIFNIDTFRPGFDFPADAWFSRSDGYLE